VTKSGTRRLRVVVGIWWRSMIVSIVGGAVIGALLVLPLLVFADDVGIGDVGLFAYFGGGFGLVLGFFAGAIIGGFGAALLVPFRSAAHCLKVVRLTACILVGLAVGLMLLPVPLWALPGVILGVGGAYLACPWVIGWYIRRCEPPVETNPGPT
jgi:hypothetical protein